MTRYLTPSKIAVLCVICLQIEGSVTTSSLGHVYAFLLQHVVPDNAKGAIQSAATVDDDVIPLSKLEKTLIAHPSAVVGRTLWDLFLKRLWTLDSLAALDVFVTNFSSCLSRSRETIQREAAVAPEHRTPHGTIARTSPLGAFIRRCYLEYSRLQFQDTVQLWQDLVAYRGPSHQHYEKRNASEGRHSLDVNLSSLGIGADHPLTQIAYGTLDSDDGIKTNLSGFDVERLLEFQVSELQRLGGRLPTDMRKKINEMSKGRSSLPHLTHYLKFLDSWRAGDYSSAYDNLHRYFDYTMQSRDRTFYQYALLNLAILQADFGFHKEAVPAMQEAIATARENKDATCLNFCMSWLYHFGKTFPQQIKELGDGISGNEVESLNFLKSRAKETEMWSLLSSTHLSEAKLELQNGGSIASVFESISKANHITVVKSTGTLSGSALLMKGSLFSRVGLTNLSWTCADTFLQCFSEDAPAEDIVKCMCRMASQLAQRGRYDEAIATVDSIPMSILSVLKYQQYTTFYRNMLQMRRFLHRNDISAAELLLSRLRGQGAPDLELKLSLNLLHVDLLSRRQQFSQAIDLIESLAKTSPSEIPDVLAHVKLLNTKTALLARCNHPVKAFTICVRAANLAYRSRLLPALWEANANLAVILNELSEFPASISLLTATIPQVLECEDCSLAATVYSRVADAYMGLAGLLVEEKQGSTKQREYMNRAAEYIDLAYEQWRRMEDLEGQMDMLSKKAKIMALKGDMGLANDLASRWLEVREEYEGARV